MGIETPLAHLHRPRHGPRRRRGQAFANGLISYPTGGNVDEVRGDQIILSPPFTAARAEFGEIVEKPARSLTRAVDRL